MTEGSNGIPGDWVRGSGEKNQKLSSKGGQSGSRIDRGTAGARERNSHRFDLLSVLGALEGLHPGVGEIVFLSFSTGDQAWDLVNPDFFKSCLHIKHGAKPISVSNDTRLLGLILGSMSSDPGVAGEISRGTGSGITTDRPIRGGIFEALFQQTLQMKQSGDRSNESLS